MKTAEDYMRMDLERDAAIAETNRKRVTVPGEKLKRHQLLQKSRDDAYEMHKKHGTAPVIRLSDGQVFYSRTRACEELLVSKAHLDRLVSYGELRIATSEEARECIERERNKPPEPKLNAYNRLMKHTAHERRKSEAAQKRMQAVLEKIRKPLVRRSDGKFFESLGAACKQTGLSEYMLNKQIKAGDFIILTVEQAAAYSKE